MSDPLRQVPQGAKELFKNLSQVCSGFSSDDVMLAAVNLLVNCVRQNRAKRDDAAELFDEIAAKARHVLLEQHYDVLGRRRNVYPFHQVIEPQPVKNLSKLRGF